MKNDKTMKTPRERWLDEYGKESTKAAYRRDFDDFCEWSQTSDSELVERYRASDDKREWSKEMGAVVLNYYNAMLKKGYSVNFARSKISGIRSFLKSQCESVRIRRGAIAKAEVSLGEHEFTQADLVKMFHFGDVREKALLSLAVSLGWASDDFLNLKRDFIVPFLDKEPFTGFWAKRRKTGAPTRSHLTPEAIDSLKAWLAHAPKSQYVFGSNGKGHLSNDSLNRILKDMVEAAGVNPTGKIRFHALRKFTMSRLSASGMNQWETKLCVGKSIPSDILTYLKDMSGDLREKFMVAYEKLSLVGYQNSNHDRLAELQKQVAELQKQVADSQAFIRNFAALFGIAKEDAEHRMRKLFETGKIDAETFNRLIRLLKPTKETA